MSPRTIYIAIILAFYALFWAHPALSQQKELSESLNGKDYFALQRHFNKAKAKLPDSLRLFYGAVLANAFNRASVSDETIKAMRSKYRITPFSTLNKTLLNLEADNAIKQYNYRQAARCFQMIIDQCHPDSSECADLKNSTALWGAIAHVPVQQVMQDREAHMLWRKDKIGLIELPVRAGKDSCDLVFDTGANLSVITESSAKKLHMRVYPVRLNLGAGTTGETVSSSLAVADSLYLGQVLVKHVVFLLLPDDMLYFKQADYRQQGIIGLPLIAQLGQLNFTGDGHLVLPLKAKQSSLNNLALDGAMPIAEFEFNGTRLPYRFDSGASSSVLYAPFYKSFEKWVKQTGQPYDLKTSGVGGKIITSKAYNLKDLTMRISAHNFTLPSIKVRTTSVGGEPDQYYGNMGLDLFGKFNRLVINFKYMYIEAR